MYESIEGNVFILGEGLVVSMDSIGMVTAVSIIMS